MIKTILTVLLFAAGFFAALIYVNGWFGFDAQKIMDSNNQQTSSLGSGLACPPQLYKWRRES